MDTNVLKRNEILCWNLQIDFNEANDLFGNETLDAMQMVKTNGGAWWKEVLRLILPGIAGLADAVEIYQAFNASSSTAAVDPSVADLEIKSDGQGGAFLQFTGTPIPGAKYEAKSRDSSLTVTPQGDSIYRVVESSASVTIPPY